MGSFGSELWRALAGPGMIGSKKSFLPRRARTINYHIHKKKFKKREIGGREEKTDGRTDGRTDIVAKRASFSCEKGKCAKKEKEAKQEFGESITIGSEKMKKDIRQRQ